MNTPSIDGADILSLGASMLIVIGLVVALGWLYTRMRFTGGGSGDVINIVASRALGPKERIVLVDIANQQLLIGVTTMQIKTLHTFGEPAIEIQDMAESSGFASKLRTALKRRDQ
ncbi:MAG: flagellar biosynthetic protein FliO [Woeseiaceae bacterium]